MLIIWGTRRSVERLAIVMLSCPQGHPAAHTVVKVVTKFTLFFISLFPIRTRYAVQCTLCGMSGQVEKENAEQLVATAEQQGSASGQQFPGQQGSGQQFPNQQFPNQQGSGQQLPGQQGPGWQGPAQQPPAQQSWGPHDHGWQPGSQQPGSQQPGPHGRP